MPVPSAIRFIGHAIVTADGMIADHHGQMTPGLRVEADWLQFQAALDRSVLVVLGSIGHRRHPNPGRRRLVLTRAVERLAASPDEPLVTLWNPAGAPLAEVLDTMGISAGTVAVTGGTGTFEHFLPLYDAFVLSEVHCMVLPSGSPCFSSGHPRIALAAAGLLPVQVETLETANLVTTTRWQRAGS